MDTYKFYYDESEHSRKINYNTVTAPNYYDNFVTVVVGWSKEKGAKRLVENEKKIDIYILSCYNSNRVLNKNRCGSAGIGRQA